MRCKVLALVVCMSCDSSTEPFDLPDVRFFVTGEAATSLDASGHFVFPADPLAGDRPSIDEGRASEIAPAYFNGLSSAEREALSSFHGSPIAFDRLEAMARVELAESPYERLGPEASDAAARSRGPYFIVRMVENHRPVMSLAISGYATHIVLREGQLELPVHRGGEFRVFTYGPSEGTLVHPMSPEEAAVMVAVATHRKVSKRPVLIRPEWRFAVAYSRWKITVEPSVRVQIVESGQIVETNVLYVGRTLSSTKVGPVVLLVPESEQPTVHHTGDYDLHVRSGYPVAFAEVTIVR